jgi:RNA polymerase sigma-70 factor (ECF subfamily)
MSLEADHARRAWFREQVLPLEPALLRFAKRIAPADMDAEDIVQDVLVRMISSPDWRRIASPEAFAKTTLRHIVYDALRRRQLVHVHLLGNLEQAQIAEDRPDPEVSLLAKDKLERLSRIAAGLPTQCRRAFTLRNVYGFSYIDIADRLGITVSTVEKHLSRALVICAEALARQESDPGVGRPSDRNEVRSGETKPGGRRLGGAGDVRDLHRRGSSGA